MLDILTITGPIYLVILIGFLTTRFGLFSKADMRVMGKFVVNLALPALIFNSMAQRQIREIINPAYLLAYFAGSLGVIALGYFWCRRRAKLNSTTSAVYVMGMSCSNSGFVGYPILLLALASVAGVSLALNLMVENVIVIPLLLALADRGRSGSAPWHQQLRQSAARLAANPIILGLVAGLLVSLIGWELPQALGRTINMFAMASGALSLFVIGGALVGLPMQGMGRKVMPIVVGKLLVHPAMVLLALLVLPVLGLPALDPPLRTAALVMAAMPMMGIYPILAQAYGQESFSSAAMLITTVCSFFTLSALLWLIPYLTF